MCERHGSTLVTCLIASQIKNNCDILGPARLVTQNVGNVVVGLFVFSDIIVECLSHNYGGSSFV